MQVTLERFDLKMLLADAMEIGAKKALIETGNLKPYLSKNEAYRAYGRRIVDRWLMEDLIKPIKDGSETAKVRLSRMELEILSKSSNRRTYLPTDERIIKPRKAS